MFAVESDACVDQGEGEQCNCGGGGGLIPLLVFASILIGRVMLSAKDGFEREEVQKINKAERDTRYRERKKKEQATLEKGLGAPIETQNG